MDLTSIDMCLELMISKDEETGEYFLYHGIEHKGSVEAFRIYKSEYDNLPIDEKENWLWINSIKAGDAICKFKNSSIGTLINDLHNGIEMSDACK